ncbi:MAG: hypothetical protein ACRDT8_11425 [Micromonosporaceae bacterium]
MHYDAMTLITTPMSPKKWITTEHVAALGFNITHTARIRLNTLARRGVLTRFRDSVRPGSQSWRSCRREHSRSWSWRTMCRLRSRPSKRVWSLASPRLLRPGAAPAGLGYGG